LWRWFAPAWNEIIKHQFLLWFDNYLSRAEHELSRGLDGQEFSWMPFEVILFTTIMSFSCAYL